LNNIRDLSAHKIGFEFILDSNETGKSPIQNQQSANEGVDRNVPRKRI
jgi:hypothetical protein